MDKNYTDDIQQLPDFLDGMDDETIHHWRRWMLLTNKIDNHPDRIFVVVNRRNGQVKEYDCKGNVGIICKGAKTFGASPEDLDKLKVICDELQALKISKGNSYKHWSKKVYNSKRGDKGILQLRQSEILDLMGRFYTHQEIHKIITDKWGAGVSVENIQKFGVENKAKIDKRKADFVLNSRELRLATDAGRLEVLSMLAYEMERKFEVHKHLDVSKELRAIIDQIRKEVKGDELKLTIDGKLDIQATIQANKTVHELLQRLPINLLVVGLTAAKQGLNPASVIASLANSYYSKWNGFNQIMDKSEVQLPGQYIRTYNWDEIKYKNEQQVEDVEGIEVYEDKITPARLLTTKSKKAELMELLNKYKKKAE